MKSRVVTNLPNNIRKSCTLTRVVKGYPIEEIKQVKTRTVSSEYQIDETKAKCDCFQVVRRI